LLLHLSDLQLFLAKRYTKEHEWISVEDNVGTIGITDYAQKSLGDVVFVEIPSPGQAIARKGEYRRENMGTMIDGY
jgi:glycine cleavage system H protein